jgi:hypothetical protein
LTPPVAAGLVIALAVVDARTGAADVGTSRTLFAALEMAVPLAAGVGAASLVGQDRAVELHLSLPTAYRGTLLRRLGISFGCAAVVAGLVAGALMITGWWDRWPANHGAVAGQLTWLAPAMWLAGLGFLAGAVFRSPGTAGGLVGTYWIIQQVLAGDVQDHRWSRPLFLFATTRGADPGDWTANRYTLTASAIALTVLGWLLLGRTERLVRGSGG